MNLEKHIKRPHQRVRAQKEIERVKARFEDAPTLLKDKWEKNVGIFSTALGHLFSAIGIAALLYMMLSPSIGHYPAIAVGLLFAITGELVMYKLLMNFYKDVVQRKIRVITVMSVAIIGGYSVVQFSGTWKGVELTTEHYIQQQQLAAAEMPPTLLSEKEKLQAQIAEQQKIIRNQGSVKWKGNITRSSRRITEKAQKQIRELNASLTAIDEQWRNEVKLTRSALMDYMARVKNYILIATILLMLALHWGYYQINDYDFKVYCEALEGFSAPTPAKRGGKLPDFRADFADAATSRKSSPTTPHTPKKVPPQPKSRPNEKVNGVPVSEVAPDFGPLAELPTDENNVSAPKIGFELTGITEGVSELERSTNVNRTPMQAGSNANAVSANGVSELEAMDVSQFIQYMRNKNRLAVIGKSVERRELNRRLFQEGLTFANGKVWPTKRGDIRLEFHQDTAQPERLTVRRIPIG